MTEAPERNSAVVTKFRVNNFKGGTHTHTHTHTHTQNILLSLVISI